MHTGIYWNVGSFSLYFRSRDPPPMGMDAYWHLLDCGLGSEINAHPGITLGLWDDLSKNSKDQVPTLPGVEPRRGPDN